MRKEESRKTKYLYFALLFVIVFLSVGYSSFDAMLEIKDISAIVRIEKEVRISAIQIESTTANVEATYTDFNVDRMLVGVKLPDGNSSVKYKVSVTNLGGTEVGLFSINNLPDDLDYKIDDYALKNSICDNNNQCNLGITKDFYITIYYKDTTKVSQNIYDLNLLFDFRVMHTITYDGITVNDYPTRIIDGDTLEVTFTTPLPKRVVPYVNGEVLDIYTYKSHKMTIENVINDIVLRDDGYIIYTNGTPVYFNVSTGKVCSSDDYKEDNSLTGYNGIDPGSTQTSCLKFYAFNDDNTDVLNLLLDHNTTNTVVWHGAYSNATGPSEVLTQLINATESWQGTEPLDNFTLDQSASTSGAKYTIYYGGANYKARLITAREIALIIGRTDWYDETATSMFYFDTGTTLASETCTEGNLTGCKYGWLYDRSSADCELYGCLNNADSGTTGDGYWTSSAVASSPVNAWRVNCRSRLGYYYVNDGSLLGVRPVIEVHKANLQE